MKPTRSRATRRAAAVLVSALLGLAGVVAYAAPASAHSAEVSGACVWDPDSGQWAVTWSITSAEPGAYRLVEVTAAPEPVTGIEATLATGFPHDAAEPLTGEQRLPEDATSASLSLRIEWDDGHQVEAGADLTIPADCQAPTPPPLEIAKWSFGCDSLTIIVDNPSSEDATLTFAPSTGEPFDVEVAGGDSATVAFPAAAGLTVDVRYQGASIVHADDPITITPAAFEALTCDEDDAAGGLPATGGPVALIAGGALLLLGLGAGLFLVARRRRIIFTP